MLKTLHGYLTRDLLKVTLLSLVAITLFLTVLAIIQPLRKLGLAGEQVLLLFAYTLPVMLSFTLPVATLFAATLVYGRFSQDNELLASRVSGISTLALLKPPLVMGAIVTVISLALSNFVAPNLTTMAGVLQANAREFIYHRLKTRGYIDIDRGGRTHVIHADRVDPDNDTLHGVVYAYVRRPRPSAGRNRPSKGGGVFLATASAAYLSFVGKPGDDARVVVQPLSPSVIQTGENVGPPIAPEAQRLEIVMPLDNPVNEKPSWYSWTELLETLRHPDRYGEIRRQLNEIKQLICNDLLAERIVQAIRAGRSYRRLAQGDETYEIEAASAHKDDDGSAVLTATAPAGGPGRRVTVLVRRAGQIREMISGRSGKVTIARSPISRKPQVTLKLQDDVVVQYLDPTGRRQSRANEWARGEVSVPDEIRRRSEEIGLSDLYADPGRFTTNQKIIRTIDHLKTKRIPNLKGALIAELNARIAYGVSCFLMVAMGAALGVIFRGGQFISAFAISAVPAAVVIALLLMGKGMVRNPDVSTSLGLACIWGGIIALLVANLLLYLHLARK
ncbi:MAG TPA: LptF/LptG family permease [Phycisphaerae bacterium]|nr:LptF/LptG family permease [Phycisphaerae bacterium]